MWPASLLQTRPVNHDLLTMNCIFPKQSNTKLKSHWEPLPVDVYLSVDGDENRLGRQHRDFDNNSCDFGNVIELIYIITYIITNDLHNIRVNF